MRFAMCGCGVNVLHGHLILDVEGKEVYVPFPFQSKAMGFLLLDVLRFNKSISRRDAAILEKEIRDSCLPDDLTEYDLLWLSEGIRAMVALYNTEEDVEHRREVAMCN